MKTLKMYMCAALISFAVCTTTTATPIVKPRLLAPNPSFHNLPSGQHLVDVRSGFRSENGLLYSEVLEHSYYGFGMLPVDSRGTSIDDGLTVLLTFATPPQLVGMVISDLYTRALQPTLTTVAPQVPLAQVRAYTNTDEVVYDAIIKGHQSGYVMVDFGGILENVDRLTISTGGSLPGLAAPDIGVAAFVVHIPEPSTWALMLLVLIAIIGPIMGNRKTVQMIRK